MTNYDLSVVVTAHSETVVAGPTMASADAAIAMAEAAGLRVERLVGLDSVTAECRAFFTQPQMSAWRCVDLEVRDLGLSRNELVKYTKGRWLAFLDADDLFSENWLALGARILQENKSERFIIHPELNWIFDSGSVVFIKPDQDDSFFTPYYLTVANFYDALCMAPREAFLEVPYVARDREYGLGFEDWRWNLDTLQTGWKHKIARDTIIFKRRRDTSMLTELGQSGTLLSNAEALFVDKIVEMVRAPG